MKKKIIFVPGKNPKPKPEKHINYLRRALIEGVSRHSENAAHEILEQDAFEICAWNHMFYEKHLDYSDQLSYLDTLCRKTRASAKDKLFAQTWKIAISRLIYQTGDRYPFLIDVLADDHVKAMIHDTDRYFENTKCIADSIRQLLVDKLEAYAKEHEVLLIGHSLGSVISFDTLSQLSKDADKVTKQKKLVDLFLTLGSPLGLDYTQQKLIHFDTTDPLKVPHNIRSWHNVSAKGDLVSVDTTLADDFEIMTRSGAVDEIVDHTKKVFHWYKGDKGYNFHSSYGYLVGETTSKLITDWWLK